VSSVLDDLRLCATLADVQRRFADPVDVTSSLKTLGLKQGGTQTQKLERLFAVRHVSHETYPNGVDAKLFAKGFAVARVDAKKAEEKAKAVARVEHGIDELLTGTLKLVLQNTKAMIEKKQTLTAAELEQDALEDSDFVESEDDDDGGTDFGTYFPITTLRASLIAHTRPASRSITTRSAHSRRTVTSTVYVIPWSTGPTLSNPGYTHGRETDWPFLFSLSEQPPETPPGVRRETHSVLAVQTARPERPVYVWDLRERDVLGKKSVRNTLQGIETPTRHALFEDPKHESVRGGAFLFPTVSLSLFLCFGTLSLLGYDGITHWARTLLDDAHALGPRKPVTWPAKETRRDLFETIGCFGFWSFFKFNFVFHRLTFPLPYPPQITTIAEALALHKSLESKDSNKWDKQTDEEYEDADGNVYNRKTFEDLKRQGLI
jgi:hypothetical protein